MKITNKQKEKNKLKAEETKKLHKWFLQLWDKREQLHDRGRAYILCFETGVRLYRSLFRENSCCYSHILPKRNYPELAMIEDNVVIVHPDAHARYESNSDLAPKQKELREKLKLRYDRSTAK